MDQAAINDAEWHDPSNWTWGVYYSPRDTRVWVSKPVRWTGWTLNFAHGMSWVWLAVLVGLPLAVVVVAALAARAG